MMKMVLIFTPLLFFVLSHINSSEAIQVDWILLKYDAIPTSPQHIFHFSVCICSEPIAGSASPERTPSKCACSASVPGRSTPKWTSPAICMARPNGDKCIATQIRTGLSGSSYAYIRLAQDGRALTAPEWQSLSTSGRKSTSTLAIRDAKSAMISYSIQTDGANGGALVTTTPSVVPFRKTEKSAWAKSVRHPTTTARTVLAQPHRDDASSQSGSALQAAQQQFGPVPWELLARMGQDIVRIREFLLADAAQAQVPALHFNVERFKRAVLHIHNRYRWMHDAAELAQDWECEAAAKQWADSIRLRAACLQHEPQRRFGESLFFFSSLEPFLASPETMAEATVHSFYMEGRDYFGASAPARADANRFGHFTQMLWRSTRKLGVGVSIGVHPAGAGPCIPRGRAKNQAWTFYVVLRYDPPGNMAWTGTDAYADNVRPRTRSL